MKARVLILVMAATCSGLTSCGIDNDPVSPGAETEVTLLVEIRPPTSLRTLDTWTFWNLPMEAVFVAGAGVDTGTDGGNQDGHQHLLSNDRGATVAVLKASNAEEEEGHLIGSVDLPGMRVSMSVEEGASLWQLHHDGEVEEHHPEVGSNHLEVTVEETATGHHAHGGTTVSHCEVTLIAAPVTGDTLEIHLVPVQGGHGFRYENNAELPPGMYDIHLEVEPPQFLRLESTHDRWTSHVEVEFHDFLFDESFSGGTVGEATWVGDVNDSLKVSLRAGPVKQYGAVGIGMVPLTGEETINFSLRLEDPTVAAHGQALYGAVISVTARNNETGSVTTSILKPMYGAHGFHFGDNMMLDLAHHDGGSEEDGHTHAAQ